LHTPTGWLVVSLVRTRLWDVERVRTTCGTSKVSWNSKVGDIDYDDYKWHFAYRVIMYLRTFTFILHICKDQESWGLSIGYRTATEPNAAIIKPNHTYTSYTKINRQPYSIGLCQVWFVDECIASFNIKWKIYCICMQ